MRALAKTAAQIQQGMAETTAPVRATMTGLTIIHLSLLHW
jgi:hypothetical protein